MRDVKKDGMVMCIHVPHVDRNPWESDEAYADRSRRSHVEVWPCRRCSECACSAMSRVRGDFTAHGMTCQRVLAVLLTYNHDYVEHGGIFEAEKDEKKRKKNKRRNVEEMLKDIPAAALDGTEFVNSFRSMFRRLHPDMLLDVKMYRVPEIAVHQTDRGIDPDFSYHERLRIEEKYRRPLDKPAQVHLHGYVAMSVAWKDEDRQRREPAQWSDSLIPHLKLDYLYDHQWETKEEASARNGHWVERSTYSHKRGTWKTWKVWRGGRVTKTTTPWQYGYIGYQNPQGAGLADYLAKYIGKTMLLVEEYNNRDTRVVWSEEKQTDYENAMASWKNTRKSPGIGYKYYTRVGEAMAEAGLPLSLYFRFGDIGNAAIDKAADHTPLRNPSLVTMDDVIAVQMRRWKAAPSFQDVGLVPYLRKQVYDTGNQYVDEFGRVKSELSTRRVPPECILQRVGRYRRVIEAYDRRWEELHGDVRAQPRGSTLREKRIAFYSTSGHGLNAKPVTSYKITQVVAYGADTARIVVDKDNDRRAIDKRQRQLDRELRDNPALLGSVAWMTKAARTADELRLELRSLNVTGDDPLKIVKAWEFKFEREVLRSLARLDDLEKRPAWLHSRDYLYPWLRMQPALLQFSDVDVERIRVAMDNRWRSRHARGLKLKRTRLMNLLDRKPKGRPSGRGLVRFIPGPPDLDPMLPLADAGVW